MTGSSRKPGRPLRRLGRLLFGKNELRRPADRIEAALIVSLAAAFLLAAVVVICFAGHLYQAQHMAAARLRPTVAVLTRPDRWKWVLLRRPQRGPDGGCPTEPSEPAPSLR